MLKLFSLLLLISLVSSNRITWKSEPGLAMNCIYSGAGVSTTATEYAKKNDISSADWVWTSNGPSPYDACSLSVFIDYKQGATVDMVVDSGDDTNVYINGLRFKDKKFKHNKVKDISSAFWASGTYNITIESLHSIGEYGISFIINEDFTCAETCTNCEPLSSDCICGKHYYLNDVSNCIERDQIYVDVYVTENRNGQCEARYEVDSLDAPTAEVTVRVDLPYYTLKSEGVELNSVTQAEQGWESYVVILATAVISFTIGLAAGGKRRSHGFQQEIQSGLLSQ